MTLSIQRSDRRDRRLCRFGVMLVVCSLVINMVAVPKAKAVVIEASAAFGAAATTAAINGTTATTLFTGMGTSAATGSVIGLMDTYAAATGVAASGTALASTIATGILVAGGTLLVGAAAAALIGGFIDWLREEKALEAGGDPVIAVSDIGYYDKTGSLVSFGLIDRYGGIISYGSTWYPVSLDLNCPTAVPLLTIPFSNGDLRIDGWSNADTYYLNFRVANNSWNNWGKSYSPVSVMPVFADNYYRSLGFIIRLSDGSEHVWNSYDNSDFYSSKLVGYVQEANSTVSMQPNPEFIEIPNEIPEGLVLSIDTGLSTLPQGDPQAAADSIMQSAIAGSLAPSVNVAPDPSVQPDLDPEPDPDPEVPTDAPELPSNIGRLGKALTTRFPFSIPWDIAKAVKLLAAPAQAPYWEIDFMRPIAYRFDGLGDTTITIDLGKPEYEIIGITTRLTSTIGFCLALAAATKRFIWTA